MDLAVAKSARQTVVELLKARTVAEAGGAGGGAQSPKVRKPPSWPVGIVWANLTPFLLEAAADRKAVIRAKFKAVAGFKTFKVAAAGGDSDDSDGEQGAPSVSSPSIRAMSFRS